MGKGQPSVCWFQNARTGAEPAHKDLRQEWAKASRQCAGSETREQAQKPAHKDLKPKWPKPSHFRLEATYAPVSNRACSRSVPFSLNGI